MLNEWRARVELTGGWRRWVRVRLLGGPARLVLVARRRRPFSWGGVWWDTCHHRSHRRGWRCWRWFEYDALCHHHVNACLMGCGDEDRPTRPRPDVVDGPRAEMNGEEKAMTRRRKR